MDDQKRHIIITGTGRSGTTLLVQLFTALGFDTGYTLAEAMHSVDATSNAGLERWLLEGNPPQVVKSPWFVDEVDQVVSTGHPPLEAVIIPVRDLFSAAESRRRLYRTALAEGRDPMLQPGTIWKTDSPENQESGLAMVFYKIVAPLIEHDIPLYFLSFPRFATDPGHIFRATGPLMQRYGIGQENIATALQKVVDGAKINKFS